MSHGDVPDTFDTSDDLPSEFIVVDAVDRIISLLKQRVSDLPLSPVSILLLENSIDIAFNIGLIYGRSVLTRIEALAEMQAAMLGIVDKMDELVLMHDIPDELKRQYRNHVEQAILTGRLYGLTASAQSLTGYTG